jgi:ABC-type Fe3+-citrate transport system substrate-binding protein
METSRQSRKTRANRLSRAKSVGPRVTANAEQVIALDPDLILSGVTRAECLKSLTQAQ